MADPRNPNATVSPADLQRLIDLAGVRVRGEPGDVVLNKDPDYQNFVVGAPLDLFAPRGQTARVEGLYVYCMDLSLETPSEGQRFDVLGPAGDQPEPQFVALQTLLETIAPHQSFDSVDPVPGGQNAVWAITDQGAIDGDFDALALLEEAGLSTDPDSYLGTPHLENPNAAGPTTAAVSRSAVLPELDVERGPSPVPPEELEQPSRLVAASVAPAVVALGAAGLEVRVLVEGSSDVLQIAIERKKGRKWKPSGDPLTAGAHVGISVLEIPVPAKKGKYRARVQGQSDEIDALFKVKKRKRS
jgi:hypothetical protein